MSKVKSLYQKYRNIILYGVFGGLTTLVNIAAYWLMAHPFMMPTMPSTILAWAAAVTFAYVTNRRWVFHSKAHTGREVTKELIAFFACRLATGVIDWTCMYLFVEVLVWNDMVVKFAANVLVIILNYVASKLLVFKQVTK